MLRWKQGEEVTLRVTNNLAVDSSIHWHGIILPSGMDGVPGFSFPGIKPGETFTYRFPVMQSGTYWYHSHSGFQEQTGLYGAMIIDPAEPDPVAYDRDYVVMLSDWSDTKPERIFSNLKKLGHYYNFQMRTIGDFARQVGQEGWGNTLEDRAMWWQMRMSDRDISDVTGYTYTFLTNGMTPDDNWTGEFRRGEKVRLRFVNAAAMTIFDVRIPGLKMTVVAADGQEVIARFPTTLRHMSDTAELETEEPPIGQATIVYLGPAAPHWEIRAVFGEREVMDSFRDRVNARLLLLPPHDPQFRRNRERVNRDGERERIVVEWDLGYPEDEPAEG